MDELVAIELLRKVLLGERKEKPHPNIIQASKSKQIRTSTKEEPIPAKKKTIINPETLSSHRIRRRERVSSQQRQDGHISYLTANETASIPDLTISSRKITKGLGGTDMNLQLNE